VRRPAPRDLIVIGASAGGVQALRALFRALPPDLAATVVVVLHRSPYVESVLASVLGRDSTLPVSEARHEERFEKGRIYLAPRDHHLTIDDGRLLLNRAAKEHYTRPAADPLFRSAAAARGPAVIGVVLTGTGEDGVSGLIAIKEAGGLSVAQDPGEASHDSMPESAIRRDHVDAVLTIHEMADELPRLVAGGRPKRPRISIRPDRRRGRRAGRA
jgi:two-component system, chemotaxis family, protein-glutamate methylesterase/glutaminase